MELFDFLLVLDAIIIGLGVAEVLTGVGQLLRAKGATRVSGTHAVVVVLIFVALLQHWWDAWGLRGIERLTFPAMLLFVSGPVLLFLLGYLAFPATVAEWEDLEEYYYRYTRPIWGLATVYLLTTMIFRPLVLDQPFWTGQTLTRAGGVLLCFVLWGSRRRAVHRAGVTVAAILLAFWVLLYTFRISQ